MADQNMHENPQQRELLRVCRIGRAQGMKGEVTVQVFTDEPEWRFEPGSELFSRNGEQRYVVEHSRTFKNRWIIKLEGCDDRNASEALNGTELYGEADDPEDMLEADEWYPKDLIGLEARTDLVLLIHAGLKTDEWYPKDLIGLEARMDEENEIGAPAGKPIGMVVDVIDSPAQSLLKIRLTEPVETGTASDGTPIVEKTTLVPFVDELVPLIDLEEGYLTLDPPGGLIPGL